MSENALQRVIKLDKDSGKFEYDPDGYTRFIPSDEERVRIETYLSDEISRAEEDHRPIFAEARECIETYKAVETRIPESGASILPSPLARIPADQIIAWTVNTILRARPIVSFDPYFPGEYDVPVPLEMEVQVPAPDMGMASPEQGMPPEMGMGMDPSMGMPPEMGGGMGMMPPPMQTAMQTVGVPVKKTAEEIARALEMGMEFKNRERLDFERLIWTVVADCVTGAAPSWVKVIRESRTRTLLTPKVNGVVLDVANKDERIVPDGEEVRYVNVPVFNVLMPIEEDDPDVSPWLAERTPKTPEQMLAGCQKDGPYFLVKDAEEARKLAEAASAEAVAEQQREVRDLTQKRTAATPRPKCNVFEVWFYWIVRGKDPETGERVVRRYSLMGEYHHGARRLLSCFRNPYDHQRRIHVPFWQIKDAHSHAGSSTVGILKYHQKISTHAIQAELKNAFHANNFSYWHDPNGPAADYFAKNPTWVPGTNVPGKEGEDWGATRVGAEHYSLMPMIQWVAASAQQTSNVSSYESGDNIPGRTPAATVAQILQQGQQQPLLFLRLLNQGITRVMRLYLETARQFQPMGETIPLRHPETKALIEVPFRFPIGEVLDNFRVALTAADEALAQEHEPEQLTMVLNLWQQYTGFAANVAGPMMNPQATPAQMKFYQDVLAGGQVLINKIMSMTRTDEHKFDLTPAVDGLVRERAALQAQMEMMNAANSAAGGGPVSGMPGAGATSGPSGVSGEPGMEAGAPQAPPDDMGTIPLGL